MKRGTNVDRKTRQDELPAPALSFGFKSILRQVLNINGKISFKYNHVHVCFTRLIASVSLRQTCKSICANESKEVVSVGNCTVESDLASRVTSLSCSFCASAAPSSSCSLALSDSLHFLARSGASLAICAREVGSSHVTSNCVCVSSDCVSVSPPSRFEVGVTRCDMPLWKRELWIGRERVGLACDEDALNERLLCRRELSSEVDAIIDFKSRM